MAVLTFSQIAPLLKYERETGKLFWLPRTEGMTPARRDHWNRQFSGKEALSSLNRGGYKRGAILGVPCRAHQVAWLLSTGEWPAGEIDHINGDKSDNRIENLRLTSRQENMRNVRKPVTNTSGSIGVSWHRRANKWEAHVEVSGKKKYLGLFANKEDAVAARNQASARFGFHENHGR